MGPLFYLPIRGSRTEVEASLSAYGAALYQQTLREISRTGGLLTAVLLKDERAVQNERNAARCMTRISPIRRPTRRSARHPLRIAAADKTTYFVCIALLSITCKPFAARVSKHMHRRAINEPVWEPPI